MRTFTIIKSYTVSEVHKVEATTEEEALKIFNTQPCDTYWTSYDGDYDKDENGEDLITVEIE